MLGKPAEMEVAIEEIAEPVSPVMEEPASTVLEGSG